jgi:mxaJ protein
MTTPRPSARGQRRLAAAIVMLLVTAQAHAQSWEMRVCADHNSLPFSRSDEAGFENRIAAVLAHHLDAELAFVWWPQGPSMVRDQLREGNCDMIIGVPDGASGLLSTIAYYRSPYVFVFRADAGYDIRTFDDPILADLRLGVQSAAGPEHQALLERGLGPNIELLFAGRGRDESPDPLEPLIAAVADGTIDVAVTWGATGGYYAARQAVPLVVNPTPDFEPPFTPLYINMVIGVRSGDEALRDRLGVALAERWDEVQAVLDEFDVPRLALPRPTVRRLAP